MTPPPKKADDPHAAPAHAPASRGLRTLLIFLFIFTALFLLHLSLINLPYYWDEAGYFIPAARDIYAERSFIPHSTLSNAHPPLVMAYLALAWKLFGFRIAVARVGMLLVSSFALTGVFRLAERVANARVATAAVVCTALSPVFFAQSSLAHLDMMVAALSVWGLVLYLPRAATGKLRDAETRRREEGETGRWGDGVTGSQEELETEASANALERRGVETFGVERRVVRRALSVALFALAAL